MSEKKKWTPEVTYDIVWPKPIAPGKVIWLKLGTAYLSHKGAVHLRIDQVPVGFDGKAMALPKSTRFADDRPAEVAKRALIGQQLPQPSPLKSPGDVDDAAVAAFLDDDLPF